MASEKHPARFWIIIVVLGLFFTVFLLYPLVYVFKAAFQVEGKFSLLVFTNLFSNRMILESIGNTFKIAIMTTLVCSAITH